MVLFDQRTHPANNARGCWKSPRSREPVETLNGSMMIYGGMVNDVRLVPLVIFFFFFPSPEERRRWGIRCRGGSTCSLGEFNAGFGRPKT